ncbi:hypothetical protein KP509_37G008300 [Ceratopteris richardii]|uniref:Uncharacterized protein n=1 Tax=Ceratopteris richardii TaxID=49495 RepID=A0A8T2Q6F9_CERRI|nr:hypothetical protein KP509_37G002200 [Ceratopteris richardii]KAH7279163.1 hypothetical protein KP509_37G008300 [Ceratopteris richardii]
MASFRRLTSPLLRAWKISIGRFGGARLGAPQNRNLAGMEKLQRQVESCRDEDVHILWSMLVDGLSHERSD